MYSTINRNNKDSLFKIVFGEYPENALALYNAINGTNYSNVEDLQITTIKGAVYIGIENDVSFLFDNVMSLYEHQSTYNPNMPLRGLEYFSTLYSNYLDRVTGSRRKVYGESLYRIPTPRYYVLYNGKKEQPEHLDMHLSDAYEGKGDVEVRAHMININQGKNRELIELCKPLSDYTRFVQMVREYRDQGLLIEEAIEQAIDRCIQEGILAEILQRERNRVMSSLLTEFTEEEKELLYRERGYEAGRKEGLEAGRAEGRAEGLEAGRAEGLEEGRKEGLEAGRAEGMEEGRAEGLEAGRAEGRAEGLEEGRKEGLEAGRAEGRADEKQAAAKRMKEKGIDLTMIMEVTELSEEAIGEL